MRGWKEAVKYMRWPMIAHKWWPVFAHKGWLHTLDPAHT